MLRNRFNNNSSTELTYYGVYGVRRTPKQLGNRDTIKDMETIIKSLTKSDFTEFDKPKNVYYQKVEYDGQKPIGFALAERHNERGKKVIDLSVAVTPKYRGQGLAYKMANDMINTAKRDTSVSKIYWGAKKDNVASIHLAKKLGFEHDYDTTYYTIYKLDLN